MICSDCKKQKHRKCRGDTWCDCQHKAPDQSSSDEPTDE